MQEQKHIIGTYLQIPSFLICTVPRAAKHVLNLLYEALFSNQRLPDIGNTDSELVDRTLLRQNSSQQKVLLSNLGFVKRQQGQFIDAKFFYERALQTVGKESQASGTESPQSDSESPEIVHGPTEFDSNTPPSNSKSPHGTDELCALSGLFKCLPTGTRTSSSVITDFSAYPVNYFDLNSVLFASEYSKLPLTKGYFHFPMVRHLEILLSVCSIPVKGKNGVAGIALVDADPLSCLYEGRGA